MVLCWVEVVGTEISIPPISPKNATTHIQIPQMNEISLQACHDERKLQLPSEASIEADKFKPASLAADHALSRKKFT